MNWLYVMAGVLGFVSLVMFLVAARFFIEWYEENYYTPRMRKRQ
jgi:hypothetical protein